MNIIWLIFSHFIGDIALQNSWQSDNKGRLWYAMFSHCMIWTGAICITLQFLGIFVLWKALFLLIGHYLIDSWRVKRMKTEETTKDLYLDQSLHILQIIIVYLL